MYSEENTGQNSTITNTVIIGASAAGLACAACLKKEGIPYVLLEKAPAVASSWRKHYDSLHLNTKKQYSALPYLPFPENSPTYPSGEEVVRYMEMYERTFDLKPVFNREVCSLSRTKEGWEVLTNAEAYSAKHVIIATGLNRSPTIPNYSGMEHFRGKILHSSEYKNGSAFTDKRVLVVGFGNSACEITVCLHRHGAQPALSVRGAVNIVPIEAGSGWTDRLADLFALPAKLFPEAADMLSKPYLRKRYGDYARYGLQKLPYGPNVQIVRHKRLPMCDTGVMKLIEEKAVKIYPGMDRFTDTDIVFSDGTSARFDAVIFATGYRTNIAEFFPEIRRVLDRSGRPLKSGRKLDLPGLFFCGFSVSPLGMLREIGREARKIARSIGRQSKKDRSR